MSRDGSTPAAGPQPSPEAERTRRRAPEDTWTRTSWNEHNKDKARRLLQESYRGEPIRFMTTQEYKWMYDFALLTKQQLEDVGFKS